MRIGHAIDADGFYIGDVLEGSGVTPDVTVICPDGLFKAKWNGTEWVEGLTQAEIDAIKNAPKTKTELDIVKEENAALNLQLIELFEVLIEKGVI